MRPSSCPRCKKEFERRPLLQAEALHCAAKWGESEARALVDEKLLAYHECHDEEDNDE
jgi:hypothetical protein